MTVMEFIAIAVTALLAGLGLGYGYAVRKNRAAVAECRQTLSRLRESERQFSSVNDTAMVERNQDLDEFARTVAHDLKNPLGVIRGLAELMLLDCDREIDPDKIKDDLGIILGSSHKIANIIDSLLLLASLRQSDIALKQLDMSAIVLEAQSRLLPMIEERSAEVVMPQTWPAAKGYGSWVEQAWVNYLSNALKYGGDPPRVELGADAPQDGFVRFWVRDNGRGLTPEEQAQLFTPFTQLAARQKVAGHGLGLSIVQRVVEKMGGTVSVESEVGQGSRFSFTLPQGDQSSETGR